jgi:hypothetical protein
MLEAQLLINIGQFEDAKKVLISCLYESPAVRTSVAGIDGLLALSDASLGSGDCSAAMSAADEAMELALATGQRFHLVDLMMAKAEGMMAMQEPPCTEIVELIARAKAIAQRQRAVTWQSRIAATEAKLRWVGHTEDA